MTEADDALERLRAALRIAEGREHAILSDAEERLLAYRRGASARLWICPVCQEIVRADGRPGHCPVCHADGRELVEKQIHDA